MKTSRMKLISVRLSEEECEGLQALCDTVGARSVSGFVRTALRWLIVNRQKSVLEVICSPGDPAYPRGRPLGIGGLAVGRPGIHYGSDLTGQAVGEMVDLTARMGDELRRLRSMIQSSRAEPAEYEE